MVNARSEKAIRIFPAIPQRSGLISPTEVFISELGGIIKELQHFTDEDAEHSQHRDDAANNPQHIPGGNQAFT